MGTPAQVVEQGMLSGLQEGLQRGFAKRDQENQLRINDLIQQKQSLVDKISSTDKDSPEYKDLHASLQGVLGDIQNFYHPAKNPGAIEKFGHVLTDHLKITSPDQRAADQQAAVDKKNAALSAATDKAIAGAPITPAQQAVSMMRSKVAEIDKSDMTDEDKAEAKRRLFGITQKPDMKLYQLPDGRKAYYDTTHPELIPEGATAVGSQTASNLQREDYEIAVKNFEKENPGKAFPLSFEAWSAKEKKPPSTSAFNEGLTAYAKSHGFSSFDGIPPEYQQAVTEYEQNRQKYITQFGAATTHVMLKENADHQTVPVTVQDFKTPTGMIRLEDPMPWARLPMHGKGPTAATPTTAASATSTKKAAGRSSDTATPQQLKEEAAKLRPTSPRTAGNVSVGAPLFAAKNKELDDEQANFDNAKKRVHTMDANAVDALNGDQQAMLSLVANHIGMTLGAQKGARINQAVWNEAVASAPWLEAAKAKFGPDGYLTGVTLTPGQIHSMVKLAHEQQTIIGNNLSDIRNRLNSGVQSPSSASNGNTVKMKAPNGMKKDVPKDQVDHYKQLGAVVIQ